jgi:ABC-type bacteriocin/lantibiotic exporter with double-glycine peptidase domain
LFGPLRQQLAQHILLLPTSRLPPETHFSMAESHENSLKGRPLQRFFRLLSVERKEIGYVYIYAIFNGLINLSLPLGIQAIISFTLANEISSSWVLLIAVVTVGTALAGIMQIMQITITEMLQQRVFTRASFEFAYRIPRLRMEALTKYYPPELVNRFFDTLNVQKGLPKILIDFSTATLQIFFGMILLSFYHPFFVFFGVGLMLILFLIVRYTGPRGMRTSLEESDYKYQVAYWLEEIARTMSTFKLAGQSDLAMRRTDDLVSNYLDARKKHFKVLIFQFANIVGFKTIVTAGLLILGSVLLIQREINIGQFVASEIIIILIINSVEKLVLSAEVVYDVLTGMEKIGKITDLPLEKESGIEFDTVDTGKGLSVKLKDLTFSYPGDEQASLFHISMDVKAGEKVCISGFSGSGKTLLLNVISGLYDSFTGVLSYNDVPYRNYSVSSVRAVIGDCLSQKVLFRGSLLENLTMGREDVTLQNLRSALDKLGLTEFIQHLPEGLNTQLVPESPMLPEGVVRRLILAKCIAKNPHLLVMDDILRIVEPEERRKIARYLIDELDFSLITVSNDPLVASRCDKVLIMNQGTIIDSGTYEEISQRPYATNLFNL